VLASTIGRLCQGELSQLQHAFSPRRTEEAYLQAISSKTASLLSASTRIGALVAGAAPEDVEALSTFGHAFGMAFQIWDDINDLVRTEAELGKPAGHDIVEGTYTLPVIRALADPELGPEITALLGPGIDTPELDKVRSLILSNGAISSSIDEGRRWAHKAEQALSALHASSHNGASSNGGVPSNGGVSSNGHSTGLASASATARATLAGLAHQLFDDLDARAR
jgi:heptaprenyl diphosphate synthase